MQSRTSVIGGQHPLKQFEGIAKQIALPHEHAPLRFPSFPALERTATMAFNLPVQVDMPSEETTKLALFRQAAWPAWNQRLFETSFAYTMTTAFDDINTVNAVPDLTGYLPIATSYRDRSPSILLPGMTSGVGGFFPLLYPVLGVDSRLGQAPFIFAPRGTRVVLIAAFDKPITNAASLDFQLEVWKKPGQTGQPVNGAFSTTATYTGASYFIAGNDEWIRFKTFDIGTAAVPAGTTALSLTIAITNSTYSDYVPSMTNAGELINSAPVVNDRLFLPTSTVPEFYNSALPWTSTRVTAVSLLGSNITQVLNKAGTVLGGRLNPTSTNVFSATKESISGLHPAEKAYLPLETGFYTYCPPSTDMADFYDYTLNILPVDYGVTALNSAPLFRLDNTSMVNVLFCDPGTRGAIALNVDWHVEFRTSSTLFNVGISGATLEMLHQAQLALCHAGFFFENPTHTNILSKVVSGLKSVAGFSAVAGRLIAPRKPKPPPSNGKPAILQNKPKRAKNAPKRRRNVKSNTRQKRK